ncbi:putative glycerophosphodiester phosphodiesterase [Helianthus debilis subsp. tardiflorus]
MQRAIEEGADFVEADILASKDGVLMCLHDVTLDDTTDVASHALPDASHALPDASHASPTHPMPSKTHPMPP